MSTALASKTLAPYDLVQQHYTLPFQLFPYQEGAVNELAEGARSGWWAEPGTGKTAMSTVAALYHKIQSGTRTIVIMPPILLLSWYRWLQSIQGDLKPLMYRGSPKERAALKLEDYDFILCSYQIFKKDHARFAALAAKETLTIICDEATAIKNVGSENHKKLKELAPGNNLLLLSGTPITTPMDGYAYVSLVAPGTYKSLRHFELVHVAERDFFGSVTKWANLGLLSENMRINSVRILKQEVLTDLPQVTYVPLRYDLSAKHLRLYRRLAEEQLVLLEDGGRIDATTQQRLYQALQQIILNPDHFTGDPGFVAAGFEVLDQILEELNTADLSGKKLVIFANYKMTIRNLLTRLAPYKAVGAFSEISAKQKERNIDAFVNDPATRILVAHPVSAGMGLNLQSACSNVLFLELPATPNDFIQALGRVNREGQKNPVTAWLAVAEGTLQVRRQRQLLEKDETANQVQGSYEDLKAAIFGE